MHESSLEECKAVSQRIAKAFPRICRYFRSSDAFYKQSEPRSNRSVTVPSQSENLSSATIPYANANPDHVLHVVEPANNNLLNTGTLSSNPWG